MKSKINSFHQETKEYRFEKNPIPQLEIILRDKEFGEFGYLVIDNLEPGRCAGGIRMASDITREEVVHLARVMSLKFAFRNSYMGGAKAGIVYPRGTSIQKKSEILERFGEKLAPILNTLYYPGGDLGVGADELKTINRALGKETEILPGDYKAGLFTAGGVFSSICAVCEKMDMNLQKSTVAIEGYGNVGRALVRLIHQGGGKIIGLSTECGAIYNPKGLNIGQIENLREKYGDEVVNKIKECEKIPKPDLFTLKTDILVPGARPWVINMDNVSQIQARAIVPAANIPIAHDALPILAQRGILFVPDFVSSGGGIMGSNLLNSGFSEDKIMHLISKSIGRKVKSLIDISRRQQRSMMDIAVEIANKNYRQMKKNHELKRKKIKWLWEKIKEEKRLIPVLEGASFRLFLRAPERLGFLKKMLQPMALDYIYRNSLGEFSRTSQI